MESNNNNNGNKNLIQGKIKSLQECCQPESSPKKRKLVIANIQSIQLLTCFKLLSLPHKQDIQKIDIAPKIEFFEKLGALNQRSSKKRKTESPELAVDVEDFDFSERQIVGELLFMKQIQNRLNPIYKLIPLISGSENKEFKFGRY